MILNHVLSRGGSLCGRWSIVTEHDVEGSCKVVGEGAAVAFVHEGQQEGQEQQSQEKEPQRKGQPTHPLQQPGLLQQQWQHGVSGQHIKAHKHMQCRFYH